MAIRDIFKVSRKTFFNPSGWLDFDQLRDQSLTIASVLRTVFTTPKPEREESFTEAMKRLNLTEQDVQFGATNYRVFASAFAVLALLFMFYSFFLLFRYWTLFGWLMGMCASALFFAQAFKYDFWSLQMRRRKLGLKFKDWQESLLGGKDNHS